MTPATAPLAPISGTDEFGLHDGVRQAGDHPARDVEQQEPDVPHRVLDVIAEHPQEQHVGADVHDIAVKEHVGQQRRPRRQVLEADRQGRRAGCQRCGKQPGRHDAETCHRLHPHARDLQQEDREVEDDQADCHVLEANSAQRIVVVDGHEHVSHPSAAGAQAHPILIITTSGPRSGRATGSGRGPRARLCGLCRSPSDWRRTGSRTGD